MGIRVETERDKKNFIRKTIDLDLNVTNTRKEMGWIWYLDAGEN